MRKVGRCIICTVEFCLGQFGGSLLLLALGSIRFVLSV